MSWKGTSHLFVNLLLVQCLAFLLPRPSLLALSRINSCPWYTAHPMLYYLFRVHPTPSHFPQKINFLIAHHPFSAYQKVFLFWLNVFLCLLSLIPVSWISSSFTRTWLLRPCMRVYSPELSDGSHMNYSLGRGALFDFSLRLRFRRLFLMSSCPIIRFWFCRH